MRLPVRCIGPICRCRTCLAICESPSAPAQLLSNITQNHPSGRWGVGEQCAEAALRRHRLLKNSYSLSFWCRALRPRSG